MIQPSLRDFSYKQSLPSTGVLGYFSRPCGTRFSAVGLVSINYENDLDCGRHGVVLMLAGRRLQLRLKCMRLVQHIENALIEAVSHGEAV